jgi:nucleotide-binding universal stress UspA family protein
LEAANTPAAAATPASSVFARVVVGVDGAEPAYEACRQAAMLVDPGGSIEVFSAVYIPGAELAGWPPARVDEELRREAGGALTKAAELAGPTAEQRLIAAPPLPALLDEITRRQATLVAVGTRGRSGFSDLVIGGVTAGLLHRAPCSVLVARRPLGERSFPRAIVVGDDGSAGSGAALEAARHMADRFRASLKVVAAADRPVEELVAAACDADLLVVGSRGVRGLRTLGSVSERVAHRAPCSVLVVRGPRSPRGTL